MLLNRKEVKTTTFIQNSKNILSYRWLSKAGCLPNTGSTSSHWFIYSSCLSCWREYSERLKWQCKIKSLLNSQCSSSILSFGHLSFILQNTSLLNTIGTHCKAQPARQLGVAGFFFLFGWFCFKYKWFLKSFLSEIRQWELADITLSNTLDHVSQ